MLLSIDEIHPLFVHFPIALYASAWLFDFLGFIQKKDEFLISGWWNFFLAQISAIATVITGFFTDSLVGHMEKPFPLYSTHGSMQILAIVLLSGIFIIRWKKLKTYRYPRSIIFGYLVFFGISVLVLYYGSHLGAKLANRI